MAKRTFDVIVAALGLLVLSPLMVLIALAIRLTSPGPVLFRQTRMGRGLKPFEILKFRTMVADADKLGLPLTAGADPRITPLGRFLRKSKLDELPQLINVIKGDMSIVGPRPEVPKYVELFPQEFAEILQLRPGLTDLASIKYRDESALLAGAADPEHEYQTRVLPDKLELAKEYVERSSLRLDLWLILRTIARVLRFSS
jgi:lipopolysaccharide/colanic/teichoic acid biosynthesis glycosyltransferase